MSDKKLKPCFCGRTPEIVTRDVEPQEDRFFSGKVIMFVLCECGQCLFDGAFHEGFSDEEDAANAWNYRVASSPVPQEAPDPGHVEFWSVEVGVNGVPILRIETSMLSGHPDIDKYAEWVREAGEHLLAFIGPDRSLPAAPAPVEGKIGTVHWDCLYCKQRLNKFNSADCDTFCCGNHECHSFGKAQWVVATDRGIHEGDKTVEVTVRTNPDGSQTVTDISEIVDSRARLAALTGQPKKEE